MLKQVKQELLSPVKTKECVQHNVARAQVSIENKDNLMSKPSRSPPLLTTTSVRRIEAKDAVSEPELLIPSSVAELQNMIFTDGLKGVLNLIQQQAQLIRAYGQQNLTSQDNQGISHCRPTSMEKFQQCSAKSKSLYKTTAPMVAQTKPQGTSFAQATGTGTMDFSKTLLPGTLSTNVERDPIKTSKQTGEPGSKYKRTESGRHLTASPSESDTVLVLRRVHKSDNLIYSKGIVGAQTPHVLNETKETELKRVVRNSLRVQLQLPKTTLEVNGTRLRYFIGSSLGAVAQGILIPEDPLNWSQDIQVLNEAGKVPTIIQCGHKYADAQKKLKHKPGKPGYRNPCPLDVGEIIVVTSFAWVKQLPPYGIQNPANMPHIVNSEDVLQAQAVALNYNTENEGD